MSIIVLFLFFYVMLFFLTYVIYAVALLLFFLGGVFQFWFCCMIAKVKAVLDGFHSLASRYYAFKRLNICVKMVTNTLMVSSLLFKTI